jgi:biotin carboxyl carrier protein
VEEAMKYLSRIGDDEREYTFERREDILIARSGDRIVEISLAQVGEGEALSMIIDGESYDIAAVIRGCNVAVQVHGERYEMEVEDERERAAAQVAGNKPSGRRELRASMPGIVVDVQVAVGDQVEEGQTMVVLEAMKMQNPLGAEGAGTVTKLLVKAGETVAAGALLAEIE